MKQILFNAKFCDVVIFFGEIFPVYTHDTICSKTTSGDVADNFSHEGSITDTQACEIFIDDFQQI